ncbi:MAG: STAS domain-containing protein [Roseiflexaceae bacterium]|nr:STAS domain-containing protein [Roseiflexaceae bacterium]
MSFPVPAVSSSTDAARLLDHWRLRLLNGLLRVLAVVGFVTLIGAGWSDYNALGANAIPYLVAYTAAYLVVPVIAIVQRIGFMARALTLLIVLIALSTLVLATDGLLGSGRVFWMGTVVLAFALFGVRGGIVMLIVSLLALSIIGWLHVRGILSVPPQQLETLNTAPDWIGAGVVYLCTVSLAAVPFMYLLQRLGALAQRATRDAALARENARLAEERAAELERQTARLQETERMLRDLVATLETPAVEIADGVMLAPLVGQIDSQRADALLRRLLTVASARRVRLMIIDVAGVPAFDTLVAQSLIQTARALELIGCQAAITGISPAVAQTITSLGVQMDPITIARSPQDVLRR